MKINKKYIDEALNDASFPVLAATLVHISGDTSLLEDLPKPKKAILGETQGFLTEDEKKIIKDKAIKLINDFLIDSNHQEIYIPNEDDLHTIMNYVSGDVVPKEYVPMMSQELNLLPLSHKSLSCDENNLRVLVIGCGMSGILTAIKLSEKNISYKIYEKNQDVGGTWNDNSYPGSRVDIANHFYCYSFEENHEWSEYFSQQPELKEYFNNCFIKYGLKDHVNFNTEVIAMDFNEDTATWKVKSSQEDQIVYEEFDLVVSCVGQLNIPKIPNIKNFNKFKGEVFHSSKWPDKDIISNKKVAIVGSGASAFQIVPAIAPDCQELTIFQRSAPWMFPNPDYHRKVSKEKKWLLKNLPYYSRWYRFLLFWPGSDQLLSSLIIDPNWDQHESSINQENEYMRELFTEAMLAQISDHSLIKKVIPNYPPFGKRMLQDNGSWLEALHRDNVILLNEEVNCLHEGGIVSKDQLLEFDIIIFATGFKAQEFFIPIKINGGDGDFHSIYDDSPESYLGITFSNLPNFFAMYGPGTNLAHAGSIIFHSECQIRYICQAIDHLIKNNYSQIKVKQQVVKEYQSRLEEQLSKTVWQHPKVNSWYQNSQGKVVTTSPWRLLEYWNWTNNFNPEDYDF